MSVFLILAVLESRVKYHFIQALNYVFFYRVKIKNSYKIIKKIQDKII